MGRIVKGGRLRQERYALPAPEVVVPSSPSHRDHVEVDDYGFAAAAQDPLFASSAPPPVAQSVDAGPDLEALRAKAEAILDDAVRDAEGLLTDAHERGRTLVEEAAGRADGIAEQAKRNGYDAGFAEGRAAADREMNDMLGTMRGILEMAHAERHKLIESAEPELVRLALGIAERVLHQQVALDRGVVVEMAKNAIARLIERDTVTVRVHPADLERMRDHREELINLSDIRNLRIIEDQRVDRGGVVVETDAGTIDARIATQLEEARKILHIEDDVVVEPANADGHETISARAS